MTDAAIRHADPLRLQRQTTYRRVLLDHARVANLQSPQYAQIVMPFLCDRDEGILREAGSPLFSIFRTHS